MKVIYLFTPSMYIVPIKRVLSVKAALFVFAFIHYLYK